MTKFDKLAERLEKYDEMGTEYFIDYENKKIIDLNLDKEIGLDFIEEMLDKSGY